MLLPRFARDHGGARLAEHVLARHRCLSWPLRAHTTITEISEVPRLPSHASRAGQVMEGRSTSTMESWLMLAREASSRPTPAPHPVFLAHLLLAQVHTTFRLRVAVQMCSSEVPNIRTRFPPSLLGSRIDRCKHSTTR